MQVDHPQEKGQKISKPKLALSPLTKVHFWKIASAYLNSINMF